MMLGRKGGWGNLGAGGGVELDRPPARLGTMV